MAAAIADSGGQAGHAGLAISAAIQGLPEGLDSLAPTEGALPLDALASLVGPLAEARSRAERAAAVLRASPEGLIPGPVADVRLQAIERIDEVRELLGPARSFVAGLATLAGRHGPRSYLVFAQNPAELRGTGGLWGAYAILTLDDGRFDFSRFQPISALEFPPVGAIADPNPDYRRNYEQWGAPGYWPSTNLTPDFPSAARAALSMWNYTEGQQLDGVITADPFALQRMLRVTGAVRLSRPPIDVSQHNVVDLLGNRAYTLFRNDQVIRKTVLGAAARVVLDDFLGLDGRGLARLRALAGALADGHLRIYARDPEMQRGLVTAGLDGGLRSTGVRGDLLAVVVNSASNSKVDFFSRRTIHHDVELLPGGTARSTTETTIENGAPTSGQPRYVLGPPDRAGDNVPLLTVFCGRDCGLIRADRDRRPIRVHTGSELGYPYYQDYFTIPAGGSRTLTLRTLRRESWQGGTLGGRYRLTVLGQTTVRPTRATITIHAPSGMRFTSATDGVRTDGDVATWNGVLIDRLELVVQFRAPSLPVRLWRALTSLF